MLSALVLVAPNLELFSTTYLNTVVMKMCLLVPVIGLRQTMSINILCVSYILTNFLGLMRFSHLVCVVLSKP